MNEPTAASPGIRRAGRWSRLCLKELRETLRDRRTLITLVLMPLLVYPVLSLVFQRSLLSSLTSGTSPKVVIGVTDQEIAEALRQQLAGSELYLAKEAKIDQKLLASSTTRSDEGEDASSKSTTEQELAQKLAGQINQETSVDHLEFRVADDLQKQVQAERLDIAVLAPHQTESKQFELIYRERSALSQTALKYVEDRLLILNEISLRQRLDLLRQPSRLSVRVLRKPIQAEASSGSVLSTIIPMILILMTVTGAVYPAIDLTAGERERGTLEMLMASPAPRFRLLLAKYVAVVLVAFLTALVNLFAMTITLWSTGLSAMVFGEAGLHPVRILQILALLVLFAAFFSAVLLSLTSFARSFKEAQAYLIPLMLLSLGPGVVSLMPGLELNGLLAITPISNIVLLARDLCGGEVNPIMASAAVLSTSLYTLAAIGVAAKIFGADAVMSGSNPSLQVLLQNDSTPAGSSFRVSTVGGALLCLAVLFPVYFVLLSLLAKLSFLPIWARLVLGGISTSFLFGVFPWVAARIQKLDLAHAFQTSQPSLPSITVAVLLGFTVWPLAHESVVLMQQWGLAQLSPEKMAAGEALLAELKTANPLLILFGMALAPAIFEELFFRGYLFSALRASTDAVTTIVGSAVLFGLFHVVSSNSLSVERLLPSTMMGLILGWLCYQSRSVLPGILLHACHNGFLTMLAYYKDDLARIGWGMDEQTHMPIGIIVASLGSLVFGIFYIGYLPQMTGRNRG